MTRKTVSLLGVSIVVAFGMFVAKVLIAPNVTEAASTVGIDPEQIALSVTRDLPLFDDKYQRHMGVLDTLPQQ